MDYIENKILDYIGEKEEEDELFLEIDRNPDIQSNSKILQQLCYFLMVLGGFFFIFGLFSFMYKDKQHVFWFGFICVIHIVGGLLGAMAIKRKNRYLLLCFVFSNMVWLLATFIFIFYYVLKLDASTSKSKKQFKKEILLHVGWFFYIPMALFGAYLSFRIMHTVNVMKQSSDGSIQTESATAKVSNKSTPPAAPVKTVPLQAKDKTGVKKAKPLKKQKTPPKKRETPRTKQNERRVRK